MQRCGPDGARQIVIPSSGRWIALDGAPAIVAPLVPRRRLLALEAVDQIARDEAFVEHDRLVVGAVAHADRDQRAQAEVAIGANDRLERILVVVEKVDDAVVAPERSSSIPPSSVRV